MKKPVSSERKRVEKYRPLIMVVIWIVLFVVVGVTVWQMGASEAAKKTFFISANPGNAWMHLKFQLVLIPLALIVSFPLNLIVLALVGRVVMKPPLPGRKLALRSLTLTLEDVFLVSSLALIVMFIAAQPKVYLFDALSWRPLVGVFPALLLLAPLFVWNYFALRPDLKIKRVALALLSFITALPATAYALVIVLLISFVQFRY